MKIKNPFKRMSVLDAQKESEIESMKLRIDYFWKAAADATTQQARDFYRQEAQSLEKELARKQR